MKCLICKTEFPNIKALSNHLRFSEKIAVKDYYDTYLKKPNDGVCPVCGKPTKFDCLENGYKHHCSYICANGDKDVQKKQQETTQKHYGVTHPAQNKDVVRKMQTTCVNLYGAANGHGEEQKEQIKKKALEKYGVEYAFQSEDVKEKARVTKVEKYGDAKFTNREQCKQTMQTKYGVSNCSQLPDYSNKVRQTKIDRYGDATYNNNTQAIHTKKSAYHKFELENDCTSVQNLVKQFGTGWLQSPMYKEIVSFVYKDSSFVKNSDIERIIKYYEETGSHFETDVYQYVKCIYSGTILRRTRKIIPPKELDIYIPDKKIAIECNGNYWHSSEVIAKQYHLEKSRECQEKGIRLIHIYEFEWVMYPDKIKQLLNIALGSVTRIYARQCDIRLIDNKTARPFNEATHLQGHRNAQVTYGLFYKDELVQLMSFSKTHYNRNLGDNDWEIIRGCPGSNNIVVGGVSKLFKHFVNEHHPNKVFSYCDFNKFDGNSYLQLGMSFIGYTGPNKWWLLPNGTVVERNPHRYQELKGNSTIWGSGSLKFSIVG